jgi:NAD(P)-dependent dehydrogenase (short-subunit alcohol dehydrogenase family)
MSDKIYDPTPARSVAFLGLGVMGYPMAGHLARAGHRVTVYNRNPARAEAWVAEYGGRRAPTPQAAAAEAELVCACVGNDDDVRAGVSHTVTRRFRFRRSRCRERSWRAQFSAPPTRGGATGRRSYTPRLRRLSRP